MAYIIVSSGQSSSGIILSANNSMFVLSSGTATNTAVNSTGGMFVSSGGTAISTTLKRNGDMTVFSGGVANGVIEKGGFIGMAVGATVTFIPSVFDMQHYVNGVSGTVHSGTTAVACDVSSGGALYVVEGGSADRIVVASSGCLNVWNGGFVTKAIVSSNGVLNLFHGGASGTSLTEQGSMLVSDGGVAENTCVYSLGRIDVLSGGTANDLTVYSYGNAFVSSGGVLSNARLYSAGYLGIFGGTADTVQLGKNGIAYVSRGVADHVFVSGGVLNVGQDGVVSHVSASAGGDVFVASGGCVTDTTVGSGGFLGVLSDGKASSTVASSGSVYISNGGYARNMELTRAANMVVANGGVVINVAMSNGASLTVKSGGHVSDLYVDAFGVATVQEGGAAESVVLSGGSLVVCTDGTNSGRIRSGANVFFNAGANYVFDISRMNKGGNSSLIEDWASVGGGAYADYSVSISTRNNSFDTYNLASSAEDFNRTVSLIVDDVYVGSVSVGGESFHYNNRYFTLQKTDAGLLRLDIADDGLAIYVSSGQSMRDVTIENREMYVLSGGTVSQIYVHSGGVLNIMDGAKGSNLLLASSAGVSKCSGGLVNVYSGGYANDCSLRIEEAAFVVHSDGSVRRMNVSNGGWLFVSEGGFATDINVSARGAMYVNGGFVSAMTIASGGLLLVGSGGSVYDLWQSGGNVNILSGGVVSSVYAKGDTNVSGGVLYNYRDVGFRKTLNVVSGGTAIGGEVSGNLNVLAGAVVESTYLAGSDYVVRDGVVRSATIGSGNMHVYRDGFVSGTIMSGGTLNLYAGASAVEMVLDGVWGGRGGGISFINVYNGAYLSDTDVIAGGRITVFAGGTASQIVFSSGGGVYVSCGGELQGADVYSKAMVCISSGGKVYDMNVFGGSVSIVAGYAANTDIYSSVVASYSVLCDTTVENNGVLKIGRCEIRDGLNISFGGSMSISDSDTGGRPNNDSLRTTRFVFNLENGVNGIEAPMVYGLSRILNFNKANYFVSVLSNQTAGTYELASEANGFSKEVTLMVNNKEAGTLSVGGSLSYNGRTYGLAIANDSLKLTIQGAGTDPTVYVNYETGSSCNEILCFNDMHVLSHGFADYTTIMSQGNIFVSSAGRVKRSLLSGGYMRVADGGYAEYATIDANGKDGAMVVVESGGSAYCLTLRSGSLYVLGKANNTAMSGGSMIVAENGGCGIASGTIVSSGDLIVCSGGSVLRTSLISGGRLVVSSGGFADIVNTSAGGEVVVMGSANSVTVFSVDPLYVVGGVVTETTLKNGSMFVRGGESGGRAINTRIAGGCLEVGSGGTITSTSMTGSGSEIFITDGGVALHTRMSPRDISNSSKYNMRIEDGIAIDTEIGAYSYLYITGGTLSETTVSGYGILYAEGGEIRGGLQIASGATVSLHGRIGSTKLVFNLEDRSTDNSAMINDWALVDCGSDVECFITVSAQQGLGTYALAGGASGFNRTLSVKVDGVYAGVLSVGSSLSCFGKSYGLVVRNDELQLDIQEDANGVYIPGGLQRTGISLRGNAMQVLSGGVVSDTTMDAHESAALNDEYNTEMFVFDGGTATNTIDSCGVMFVSGGRVNSTTLDSRGVLIVSCGIAENTTMSGGLMTVSSGSALNVVVSSGGSIYANEAAVVSSAVISSGGIFYVSCDATAVDTVLNDFGHMYVQSGGTAINTIVKSTSMIGSAAFQLNVSSGGVLLGMLQNATGSVVNLEAGAKVVLNLEDRRSEYSALIYDWSGIRGNSLADYCVTVSENQVGGTYRLAANATGFSTDVAVQVGDSFAGYVSIGVPLEYDDAVYSISLNGSMLQFNIEKTGTIDVSDGAVSSGLTLTPGMKMLVYEGGSAINTLVSSGGGVDVYDSGIASATSIFSGGSMNVRRYRGKAFDTVVYRAGLLVVNGGVASNTVVRAGGSVFVSSGSAIETLVSSGGSVVVFGGHAESAVVSSDAKMLVSASGWADFASLNGSMAVSSGGFAYGTMVNSGGRLYISSGAYDMMTEVNSRGSMFVSNGGEATGTTVNNGGDMYIFNGGRVYDVAVNSNGTLVISSGGELCGSLQIANGADVSAYGGAKISFDLENRMTDDPALISNWSQIWGGAYADYFVTVSSDQASGSYALASGVSSFGNTVSVTVGDRAAGGVSVGNSLSYHGNLYSLAVSNGELRLSIAQESTGDAYVDEDLSGETVSRNVYIVGDNVTLEDDIVGGTIYGRIGSEDPESKDISISGCSAKRFYATGDFHAGVEQENFKSVINASVTDTRLSGGLFMGANSFDSVIGADVNLTADGAASKLIMGGSNVGKQFDGSSYTVNNLAINGDVHMSLMDCNASSFCCGGSLLANECQEDRTGNTEIIITGGTYDAVAGGSLFQSKSTASMYSIVNGNISISISGDASIQTLYGASTSVYVGPTRTESINGNISITLDVSEGAQVANSLYVGGAGFCTVDGTGVLTIIGSGSGDVLSTKNLVGASTYAAGDDRRIGETFLNFENFNGTVDSWISFFNEFTIDGSSSVNFTNYKSDLACKNWTIGADAADHESVILSGNRLSTGKVHNIDFNNSMLDFSCTLAEGDEWTIFKVMDDNEDFQTLCNFSDAQSFLMNGEAIEWDDDELCGISENETYRIEYRFDEDENCGMLVASLA